MLIDGSMKGERFRSYVEQCLVPALKPNDIVVLDNLTSHKVAGLAEAIEVLPHDWNPPGISGADPLPVSSSRRWPNLS
jgi:hypothetical protein